MPQHALRTSRLHGALGAVLWDTKTNQIVNNESADLWRMINRAFDAQLGGEAIDLVPPTLATEIAELNELIYQRINNGAYEAGFAGTQAAYERAYRRCFSALRYLNDPFAGREFLLEHRNPRKPTSGSSLCCSGTMPSTTRASSSTTRA